MSKNRKAFLSSIRKRPGAVYRGAEGESAPYVGRAGPRAPFCLLSLMPVTLFIERDALFPPSELIIHSNAGWNRIDAKTWSTLNPS